MFYCLLCDELGHAVIDAAPGEYDLRYIANHLCLMCKIVRIHANAVSAHKSGTKRKEIPFRPGGVQNFHCIDAYFVENDGQLVHQCNVKVPLSILNHLCGFSDLDA